MDHLASLVNNETGEEILELWQVNELY